MIKREAEWFYRTRRDRIKAFRKSEPVRFVLDSACSVALFAGIFYWIGGARLDSQMVAVTLAPWSAAILLNRSNRVRQPPREVYELMASPAEFMQYAVKIRLLRNGYAYGSDVGIVSFVDGCLVFEGAACAFSLNAGYGGPGSAPTDSIGKFILARRLKSRIEYMFLDETRAVEFSPYDRMRVNGQDRVGYRQEFFSCLREWVDSAHKWSGIAVVPPQKRLRSWEYSPAFTAVLAGVLFLPLIAILSVDVAGFAWAARRGAWIEGLAVLTFVLGWQTVVDYFRRERALKGVVFAERAPARAVDPPAEKASVAGAGPGVGK